MDKFWTWIEKLSLYQFFNTHKLFGKICNREVLSYLFFGVLTTVVSLVTFWLPGRLFSAVGYPGVLHYILHTEKNFAYVESNVISWICAVAFAFVTNKLFVFASKARDKKTVLRELSSFVGGRLTTLLVDTALMFLFVTVLLNTLVRLLPLNALRMMQKKLQLVTNVVLVLKTGRTFRLAIQWKFLNILKLPASLVKNIAMTVLKTKRKLRLLQKRQWQKQKQKKLQKQKLLLLKKLLQRQRKLVRQKILELSSQVLTVQETLNNGSVSNGTSERTAA